MSAPNITPEMAATIIDTLSSLHPRSSGTNSNALKIDLVEKLSRDPSYQSVGEGYSNMTDTKSLRIAVTKAGRISGSGTPSSGQPVK